MEKDEGEKLSSSPTLTISSQADKYQTTDKFSFYVIILIAMKPSSKESKTNSESYRIKPHPICKYCEQMTWLIIVGYNLFAYLYY